MAGEHGATIHASAVLVGARAVLITGASGSGKSRLALALITAAQASGVPFGRLVGDDRVILQAAHGRLLVRPAPQLLGLLEVRGLGIRRVPFEPVAVVGLVVELGGSEAERMPSAQAQTVLLAGIRLPRLVAAMGISPLPLVLAALRTAEIGV